MNPHDYMARAIKIIRASGLRAWPTVHTDATAQHHFGVRWGVTDHEVTFREPVRYYASENQALRALRRAGAKLARKGAA